MGLEYGMHISPTTSDHKPVYARLQVPIRRVDADRLAEVEEEISRELDVYENNAVPDLRVSGASCSLNFGNVVMGDGEPCATLDIELVNYGICAARFVFSPRGEDGRVCKPWIRLGAGSGVVAPGETARVQVGVSIDSGTAYSLNFGLDTLDDILVLHGTLVLFFTIL